MFCEQCGQEIRNDAQFCDSCGAPIGAKAEKGPGMAPPPPPPPRAAYAGTASTVMPDSFSRQPDYLIQPMSVVDYLLFFLVMIIPFVNLIMLLKWSFIGKVNINRRNFARASLICIIVGVLFSLLITGSMFSFFTLR